jgi:hypothetical protein
LPAFAKAFEPSIVDPTIRSTLEEPLLANKRDGSPDWPTRVSTAKALAALDPEAAEQQHQPTVVTIYDGAAA